MKIEAGNSNGKFLMGLRAGTIFPDEIAERFGSSHPEVGALLKAGYIEEHKGGYRITDSGRAVCPTRRSASVIRSDAPATPRTQHTLPIETITTRMADEVIQRMEAQMKQHDKQQGETSQPAKAATPAAAGKVGSKQIVELVIGQPGIKRAEVMQRLVAADGSDKQKVGALITYLISSKAVSQDADGLLRPGPEINRCLTKRKPKAQKPVRPAAPVGKLVSFEESGEQKPVFRSQQPAATENTGPTQKADDVVRPIRKQPNTVKPVSDADIQERAFDAQSVMIDGTGRLIIAMPGVLKMVFPATDTRRIQKLFLAIDLDSLCA